MDHAPGFLKLVNDARTRVREITIEQVRERLKQNPQAVLMDVREDNEWQKEHAAEGVHLGKGILERDLEKLFPDPAQPRRTLPSEIRRQWDGRAETLPAIFERRSNIDTSARKVSGSARRRNVWPVGAVSKIMWS